MKNICLLSLAIILNACAENEPTPSLFTVADSAGVEVVATEIAPWDAQQGWTIGNEPILRIGLVDGDAPYLFSDVSDVIGLPDGTIVVADEQSRQIRFFDSDGAFIRAVGREGDGPGEYTSLAWAGSCGEGLLVFSRTQRRLTSLSLEGELLGTSSLYVPGTEQVPYRSRCGPDGSLLVLGWGELPQMRPDVTFDFYAQVAPLWWIEEADGEPIPIGEYVTSERILTYNPATGGGGSGPHPFGRSVVFAVGESSLYIGSGERLQVEERDRSGALLRLMRGPDDDLTIDEAFLSGYRTADLTGIDSIQRAQLQDNDMPVPPRLPAYTEMLVDPTGAIWVERFHVPWDGRNRWGVFSPDGQFMGHVEFPDRFQVMDITADRVLGVHRDELEIERVEVYTLDRTPR